MALNVCSKCNANTATWKANSSMSNLLCVYICFVCAVCNVYMLGSKATSERWKKMYSELTTQFEIGGLHFELFGIIIMCTYMKRAHVGTLGSTARSVCMANVSNSAFYHTFSFAANSDMCNLWVSKICSCFFVIPFVRLCCHAFCHRILTMSIDAHSNNNERSREKRRSIKFKSQLYRFYCSTHMINCVSVCVCARSLFFYCFWKPPQN